MIQVPVALVLFVLVACICCLILTVISWRADRRVRQELADYERYFKEDREAILRKQAVMMLVDKGYKIKLCHTAYWHGDSFNGPMLTLALKSEEYAIIRFDSEDNVESICINPIDETKELYTLALG